MRKFLVPVILGAAVCAVLSGCSGGTAPTAHAAAVSAPAATKAAAPAVTAAPAAPALSVRGNHVKKVGQEAGVTDPMSGAVVAKFTVTKIVVDPKCTGPDAQPPQNGHYIEVFETAALAGNAGATISGGMSPNYGWQFVDAAGNTSGAGLTSGNASTCLPESAQIENNILPGDKSVGAFVLDVPATSGTLVYKLMGVDAGWEYQIP